MKEDVIQHVDGCLECAQRNGQSRFWTPPLGNLPVPERVNELACMDLVKLPASERGHKYVLVVTDVLTRKASAAPLKTKTAEAVAMAMYKKIFVEHGPPEKLLSDNGTEFTNQLFREVCKLYGVQQMFTTVFHPQSNGIVERFNRVLIDFLSNVESPRMEA